MQRRYLGARTLIITTTLLFSASVFAGAFSFADLLEEPQTITHPSGYTGNGGKLTVSVCIDPDSESRDELAIAIENSIGHWNRLKPEQGNSKMAPKSGVPSDHVDAESVLMHEMGHCMGLAHPNLASESGLRGNDRRFARALPGGGRDDGYTLDDGGDGVIGSSNDQRGTDINLLWFRKSNNDPFSIDSTVDASTYGVLLADLPGGDSFPKVAGAQVAQSLGLPRSEAVMHQGIFYGEKRTALGHDDVAMVRLAMSGIDRKQDSASSYDLELVYEGVSSDCDITVKMSGNSFAYCSVSGTQVASNHWAVSRARIQMASTDVINWHFSDERNDDRLFQSGFGSSD